MLRITSTCKGIAVRVIIYNIGYKQNHSIQTALFWVANEIRTAIDRNEVLLLYSSISVPRLIQQITQWYWHAYKDPRLQRRYATAGVVLRWLKSYLNDRKQNVVIDRMFSSETTLLTLTLLTRVPQRSALVTLLFSVYVQPIDNITHKHDLKYQHYVDDQQLFCLYVSSLSTGVVGQSDVSITRRIR